MRLVGLIKASITYIAPNIKAFCLRLDFAWFFSLLFFCRRVRASMRNLDLS